MKKSSYHYYAERQTRISNLYLARHILVNVGLVLGGFTLIILGITQLTNSWESPLALALPTCLALSLLSFLLILPVNYKLRELKTKKRSRIKDPITHP